MEFKGKIKMIKFDDIFLKGMLVKSIDNGYVMLF